MEDSRRPLVLVPQEFAELPKSAAFEPDGMSILEFGRTARKAVRSAGLAVLGGAVTLGLATGLAHAAAHTAATNTDRMYGDPAAAAPYWAQQSLDDCGLMAAADVIGQLTKREVSEQEIIAVAQRMPSRVHPGPVYTPPTNVADVNRTGRGTDPGDLPVLLARYGIGAVLSSGVDMDTLERYLAGGHKVIAGVNAELIWGIPVETMDVSGNPAADHAVVVTGVDTATGTVHLNDSASAQGRNETVPIEVFVKSWGTSNDALIVTREVS